MSILWGTVLIVLGTLAWGGQTLSWLAPRPAARMGLTEEESNIEPAFWADVRGEAAWDAFTLWTLIVAGILLIVDSTAWALWGLIGGGIYVYFAGRGIFSRAAMIRRGLRVGAPNSVQTAFIFLSIWGLVGAVTVVASFTELA